MPLRVAHLTTVDLSLRYLVLPQLEAVRREGGEPIGISAPGPHVGELEARGIRHVPLHSSTRAMDLRADLAAIRELWGVLRQERPDVLHTHNPKPGLYGRVLGRLAGVPVVVNTVHGLYATPTDRWRRRALVYALEAVASRFSHAELVQSREDLDFLCRWRISPPGRTTHLGNGVDLRRFDPAAVRAADVVAVRNELGVQPGQVLVGAVGRLVAEKGYLELLEAMASLDERFVLAIVGAPDPAKPDSLPPDVVAAAAAAGVRFLGHRDDVERLYAAMDVFVLASHREGFPRAAMEAAAMGRPVVATDIRGCREAVVDGETGVLVPVGDPGALAAAIRKLGEDPDLRRQLGSAGRELARRAFDERLVVEKVLASYDRVRRRRRLRERLAKRSLDVVVAAGGLVVTAPIQLAVWVAVRRSLGRPAVFVQERPGLGGRPFRLVKFRTMRDAVDADGLPLPDEERLTRLGAALRATSLDELPELLHVLRGQMSLVGPRPLLMEYLDRYTPEQARRHEVRPGLTGLAQVSGRNDQTWEQRLALDVRYVDSWSFTGDLRILARTVGQVVHRRGVAHGGHVTMPRFTGTRTGAVCRG